MKWLVFFGVGDEPLFPGGSATVFYVRDGDHSPLSTKQQQAKKIQQAVLMQVQEISQKLGLDVLWGIVASPVSGCKRLQLTSIRAFCLPVFNGNMLQ